MSSFPSNTNDNFKSIGRAETLDIYGGNDTSNKQSSDTYDARYEPGVPYLGSSVAQGTTTTSNQSSNNNSSTNYTTNALNDTRSTGAQDNLGSGPVVGGGGLFQGTETSFDQPKKFESARAQQDASYGSRNDDTSSSLFSSTNGQGKYDQQQQQTGTSNTSSSGDGYGSSNIQNAPKTGNSTIDGAVGSLGNKLDEQTDKDGFTNLTGDKKVPGPFTGRVKNDANTSEPPVVETTSQRSERDAQGRELDSYGKPYEL